MDLGISGNQRKKDFDLNIVNTNRGTTMKIYESTADNTLVLRLQGKMMGDSHTRKVHERVKYFLSQGMRDVVVDLDALEWLNSAGLGILIASLITVRRSGGELVLTSVKGKAEEVFFMTHLNEVFRTFESVDMACEALGHRIQGMS